MARFGEYTPPTYRRPRAEVARPSLENLTHLRRLYPYLVRYRTPLALAIVGILTTRLLEALVPLMLKTAVDSLVSGPPNLALPALGLLLIVGTRFAISFTSSRVLRRIAIATAYDLRKRIYQHALRQGPAFFNSFSTGDVMARVTGDVGMVRGTVSFAMIQILTFFFTLSIGLGFMFNLSPELALAALLPAPLVAFTGARMSRRMFPLMREQREAMTDVTSFVQENFNGIRTIQAMAQEGREIDRFSEISNRYASLVFRTTRFWARMDLVMPFVSMLSPLIILGYGGHLVLQGQITLGTFTAFFAYMAMVTMQFRQIGWMLAHFSSAAAAAQRLFEVLDHVPEIVDAPKPGVPAQIRGGVRFANFTYAYPGAAEPAVVDINIDVAPGETVAFIGRIGCGKSTLLRALARLIDPPPGTVFVDGHDIRDYPLKQLRSQVAPVPQDAFLFSDTIRDNISFDDPQREDPQVWGAAESAQLAESIRGFPEQMGTVVGERGITLSGGQKQRATLARGLIRTASILALDDCFAAVDTRTEERILHGLERVKQGRTTFIVSHRVSTARHADRIFVLEAGRVIESGTHAQLLALDGVYASLERVQSNQERDRERKRALLKSLDIDLDSGATLPRTAPSTAPTSA